MPVRTRLAVALAVACAWITAASHATTYVVNPEGTGDFPTIAAAIGAAVDGDRIELADGTFTGADSHNLDFAGKAITVCSQSGDPSVCIIDCGGGDSDPDPLERGLEFHSGEDSTSVLADITIINGIANQT
jgi:hypothetical protein